MRKPLECQETVLIKRLESSKIKSRESPEENPERVLKKYKESSEKYQKESEKVLTKFRGNQGNF